MKIRELWKKIDDKLRPVHVKGDDVNDAFTVGSEEAPSYFVSSQQDERPRH
jgi:hypothetical protein